MLKTMDVEGFRRKLWKYLPDFYNDEKFSDFEFLLNGGAKMKGHKFLLLLRCDGWNIENLDSMSRLDLSGYRRTTSDVFIEWIYTGIIPTMDKSVWKELLDLSVSFNLSSLYQRCKIGLVNNDKSIVEMDKTPENFEVGSRNVPVDQGDTAELKSNTTRDTHPDTCIVKPKKKSQRLTTGAKQNRTRSFTRRMQHCQLCEKNFTSQFRWKKHLQSTDHKRATVDCKFDKLVGAGANKYDVCEIRIVEDCKLDKNVSAGSQKCDVCCKRKVVGCKLDKKFGAGSQKCDVYGKLLDSQPDLEQHLFQHSEKCNGQNCRSEKADADGLQVFTCDFCTESCTSTNDHEIHNTVSKVPSEFCHQEFVSDEKFKKHNETHAKVKVLKCDVCSKVFKTAQNLNRHLRLHTGEKPYLCSHCGQGFIQLTQLQVHLRGHSGERPYHCGYCSKTFASKFIYNQHVDIHTAGHKKYICHVCGQGFNRQSNCRRHIQLHTDSKPFKCDACGKAYSTKHALKTHQHQTLSAKSCRNSGVTPPVSMATVAVTLSNSLISIMPPFISNTFINVQTLPEK